MTLDQEETITARNKALFTTIATIFGSENGMTFFALNDRASSSVRTMLQRGKESSQSTAVLKHEKKLLALQSKCDKLINELEEYEDELGKAEKLAELTAEQLTLKSLKSVRHYTFIMRFHVLLLLSGVWAIGAGFPVLWGYAQELCGDFDTCIRLVLVQLILMVLLAFTSTRKVNRRFLPLQFEVPELDLPPAKDIKRTIIRWERVDKKVVFVPLPAIQDQGGWIPLRPRKATCIECNGNVCSKCKYLITDCTSCSGQGCGECCRLVPESEIQLEYIKFLEILTKKKKYVGEIPEVCVARDMKEALELAAKSYAERFIKAYEEFTPLLEEFVSSSKELHESYVQYIEQRLWWITFWERLLFFISALLSLVLLLTFPLSLAFKVSCKGTLFGYGCGLVGFGMGSIVFTLTIIVSRKNYMYEGDERYVETLYTKQEVEIRGLEIVQGWLRKADDSQAQIQNEEIMKQHEDRHEETRKDDELEILESQPQDRSSRRSETGKSS